MVSDYFASRVAAVGAIKVVLTMDCEPTTATSHLAATGPADWTVGEDAVRGYVEVTGEYGLPVAFFVHPEAAVAQGKMFRELEDGGERRPAHQIGAAIAAGYEDCDAMHSLGDFAALKRLPVAFGNGGDLLARRHVSFAGLQKFQVSRRRCGVAFAGFKAGDEAAFGDMPGQRDVAALAARLNGNTVCDASHPPGGPLDRPIVGVMMLAISRLFWALTPDIRVINRGDAYHQKTNKWFRQWSFCRMRHLRLRLESR